MSDPHQFASLADRKCVHRESENDRLSSQAIDDLLAQIPEWSLASSEGVDCLERTFAYKDFDSALQAAHRVGTLADEQDHHPWLGVEWGKLTVRWSTHTVKGISENDFIMAAKVDRILED